MPELNTLREPIEDALDNGTDGYHRTVGGVFTREAPNIVPPATWANYRRGVGSDLLSTSVLKTLAQSKSVTINTGVAFISFDEAVDANAGLRRYVTLSDATPNIAVTIDDLANAGAMHADYAGLEGGTFELWVRRTTASAVTLTHDETGGAAFVTSNGFVWPDPPANGKSLKIIGSWWPDGVFTWSSVETRD